MIISTTLFIASTYASERSIELASEVSSQVIYISDDGGTKKCTDIDSINLNGSTYFKLRDICNALGLDTMINTEGLEYTNVDGYNYYKIRDLAERDDFSCIWDERTSTIRLDNRYNYVGGNKLGNAKVEGQMAVKASVVNGYINLLNDYTLVNYPVVNTNIIYFNDSKDYFEIAEFIKANIDKSFDLSDYIVKEIYDVPNGLNELDFYYKVLDVPSDYYYDVKIVNNSVFLITKYGEINPKLDIDKLDKPEITDEQLKALAIKADGYENLYSVEEQRISKRFFMDSMEFKYEVETVYRDENGSFFCTLYTYKL